VAVTKGSNKLCEPDKELVVQLAHSSVKDYLTFGNTSHGPLKQFGIQKTQGHHTIAETCLHYLLQLGSPNSVTPAIGKDFPLAQYAAEFWPSHAQLASSPPGSHLQQLMEDLFMFHTNAFTNWVRIHDHDQPWRTHMKPLDTSLARALPSPLYFASLTGLNTVVSCILANDPIISESEGLFGNALHAAVRSGHHKIVELLLHYGMRVDTQGPYGDALHTAAYEGQARVCQLLLDMGAEWNIPGEEFGNALEAAIYGGHVEVVQVLLDRGADITAPGKHYIDGLHATCSFGNVDILRLLLKQRVINPLGKSYNRALHVVSKRGCTQMMALLKQYGPSPRYRDNIYGSALHAAAANACTRTIELLLDQGADIDAIEEEHGTALCIATSKGDVESVELLLDRDADITLEGTTGTALYIASGLGHTLIVRLLLQQGANVNSTGGHFGTPLQAACYKGNVDIARLLLISGAHVNASAGEYGSALHAAACGLSAQAETAQLLIAHGANVNAWNADYETPLKVALSRRNLQVVELLRGYGARLPD
jgi:ankyrin repeat protein